MGREQAAREAMCALWSAPGPAPSNASRHLLYALRAMALMHAGHPELATKARRAM
jgi:hypothetical protein